MWRYREPELGELVGHRTLGADEHAAAVSELLDHASFVVDGHAGLVAVVRRDHVDESHDRVRLIADTEDAADLRIRGEPRRMQIRERLVARVLPVLLPVVLAHALGVRDSVAEMRGRPE